MKTKNDSLQIRPGFLFIFLISVLIVSPFQKTFAVSDTTVLYKSVVFIGHINLDNAVDTVIAVAGKDKNFSPKFIKWGKDNASQIPESLKVSQTTIVYPTWEKLRVSCSFDKITTDTLFDLAFIIWGKVRLDSVNTKDTATSVCLFGKLGLDTLSFIDLTLIDSFLTTPYIGMKLVMRTHFTNCQIRDFTYRPSYEFNKIIDTIYYEPPRLSVSDSKTIGVKLYPNPAIYYTNIELNNIQPGRYSLNIINLVGEIINVQSIDIQETESIKDIINLEKISSGVYYLRISANNKIIGTYPIIISK